MYTHPVILVIRAIWLVRYLVLWRTLYSPLWAKANKIAVVNWVFCQSFREKTYWKYKNVLALTILKVRNDLMMFKQREIIVKWFTVADFLHTQRNVCHRGKRSRFVTVLWTRDFLAQQDQLLNRSSYIAKRKANVFEICTLQQLKKAKNNTYL